MGEHYTAPLWGLCYSYVNFQDCSSHRRRFLRVVAKKAKKTYDPDFIEKFAHACKAADEELFRILYYDCAPFGGTVKLPVSGAERKFASNDA